MSISTSSLFYQHSQSGLHLMSGNRVIGNWPGAAPYGSQGAGFEFIFSCHFLFSLSNFYF
jgi:hypothetical protein